jgi:threonine/homoserine/homoserine lactone efflux protein
MVDFLRVVFSGVIIGISIAAPVGPIGVLCIRRTLTGGRLSGFVSGLGAASADAIYGAAGVFGISFLAHILVEYQAWMRIFGGTFLIFLGIKIFLAIPSDEIKIGTSESLLSIFLSTFFLTLTNPMTMLSFAALYSSISLAENDIGINRPILFVIGVFLGSSFWWLIISQGVGIIRNRFTLRMLQWVNRISGLIILGFGIFTLYFVLF